MTLGSFRTDGYPCSCSTSATNEFCTCRGPSPLLEVELSRLASQALSGKCQSDERLVQFLELHEKKEVGHNPGKGPSDPRDLRPIGQM